LMMAVMTLVKMAAFQSAVLVMMTERATKPIWRAAIPLK
jgi:hypothetical protein